MLIMEILAQTWTAPQEREIKELLNSGIGGMATEMTGPTTIV